jgi:hypothetical protein
MPMRGFDRKALVQLLVSGYAVVFGLIEHAQAQPVNPPHPPPPPVVNPSSPNTVPQPSYTPLTPSTPSTVPSSEVTPPSNEEPSSTTALSEGTSVAKTRSAHHRRGRSIGAGPTLGSYYCGYYGWCVRIYPWAFPCQYYSSNCYPYGYYRRYGWYRY